MKALKNFRLLLWIAVFFMACNTIDDTLHNNNPVPLTELKEKNEIHVSSDTFTIVSVDSSKETTVEIRLDSNNAALIHAVQILKSLPDTGVWKNMKKQLVIKGDSVLKIHTPTKELHNSNYSSNIDSIIQAQKNRAMGK